MNNFEAAWLRYEKTKESESVAKLSGIVCDKKLQGNQIVQSAIRELQEGFRGLFGRELAVVESCCENRSIILSIDPLRPVESLQTAEVSPKTEPIGNSQTKKESRKESYRLSMQNGNVHITGSDANGLLYGTFSFLRKLTLQEDIQNLQEEKAPVMPLRMLNHWDNMDGSIERGYSGDSFFFA